MYLLVSTILPVNKTLFSRRTTLTPFFVVFIVFKYLCALCSFNYSYAMGIPSATFLLPALGKQVSEWACGTRSPWTKYVSGTVYLLLSM